MKTKKIAGKEAIVNKAVKTHESKGWELISRQPLKAPGTCIVYLQKEK